MTTRNQIIDGPSKFDLMMSVFGNKPTVHFLIKGGVKLEVIIDKVGREDGSVESWIFEGTTPRGLLKVDGYFNTQRRTGWMEF